MASNPYAAAPLCVAQADPATGRYVRAFFFLGGVPRAVLEAARRCHAARADPRRPEWGGADGAVLRGFYGPRWRELLTGADPPEAEALESGQSAALAAGVRPAPSSFWGGAAALDADPASLEFGDLRGFDAETEEGPESEPEAAGDEESPGEGAAPSRLDAGPPRPARGRGGAPPPPGPWGSLAPALPEYTDVAVYPEDTVYDLRLKLCAVSGVPPWRQAFFYYLNDEGPNYPHRVTLDGAPVVADWREAGPPPGPAGAGAPAGAEAGLAVDARLEERREGLRVEALDTFTLLGAAPGVRVTRAYYADLFAALPPLGAPERPADNLAAVLRDRFRFDRLYYGALLRHWPLLSPDACALALAEPARLAAAFPALEPEPAALRERFAAERAAADRALAWRPRGEAPPGAGRARAVAVTAAAVRCAPAAARMRVALRNVFDWVPTSAHVPAAAARFAVDAAALPDGGAPPGARLGAAVPVAAAKRHASSYGPRLAPAVGRFLAAASRLPQRAPRGEGEAVAFAIARWGAAGPGPGQGAGGAGPGASARPVPLATLVVLPDGRLEVAADWREDARAGFEAAVAELGAAAAPVVAAVNAMGAAAFPIGGELASVASVAAPGRGPGGGAPLGGAMSLGAITASAFWPHALTAAAFRELRVRFRALERAGVAQARGLQQAGAFVFAFRKGVVAYDPRLAERAEAGGALPPGPGAPGAGPGAGEGADAGDAGPGRPRGRPGVSNQYAWLTDPAAAARWAAAFPGRTVRVFHRTADLRVEIAEADSLEEFELIRRYVFAFLDGLLVGAGRLRGAAAAAAAAPGAAAEAEGGPASRRLRRLQERDPDLFDLKKFDPGATVYSVLCQAGRQPHAYSEAEARALPPRRRAALVRYWNFSEGMPAFYECPDPRYPYLSLRPGLHPLGYGIPCCGKTRPLPGSRAARATESCLRSPGEGAPSCLPGDAGGPQAEGAPAEGAPAEGAAAEGAPTARHLLAYGKAVPPGRIAEMPPEAAEGLFLDALPPPYGLKLVGVEQAAPAVPAAGFAYALAFAAAEGDEPPDAVLAELAELAAALGDTFHAVGGGRAAVFASAHDLADAILGAFVRRDPGLSPFGPGGAAADAWPAILAELARLARGLEIVTLADPSGSGAVSLEALPEAAAVLAAGSACVSAGPGEGGAGAGTGTGTETAGAAGPVRLVLLVRGPAGTYPVAALNPRLYLRTPPAGRWMAARRVFTDAGGGDAAPPEEGGLRDRVAETVRAVFAFRAPARGGRAAEPDLALITRYAASGRGASAVPRPKPPTFVVETRLANLRGLCYGVLLRATVAGAGASEGDLAWFPVKLSVMPADGTPTAFGARPAVPLPAAALAAAVADVNRYAAAAGEPYAPIEHHAPIVGADGRTIGFTAGPGPAPLCFFHDPEEAGDKGPRQAVRFPYDSREVDAAIAATLRGAPPPPDAAAAAAPALAAEAAAHGRLYRLFLAEFAAALRAERDAATRGRLAQALAATRFGSAASVAALRRRLAEILRGFPGDLAAVRAAVRRAYAAAPADPGGAARAAIEAAEFAFDRRALGRLRALGSRRETAAALRELLKERIAPLPPGAPPPPGGPNMFVSCAEATAVRAEGAAGAATRPYVGPCIGRRLAVPADRLDDFYDILAADVRNPGKAGLLAAAASGVHEPLQFIQRPGETLEVSVGGWR